MARTSRKTAKKYAAALFGLCLPEKLDSVAAALAELAETFTLNPLLTLALRTPSLELGAREGALREICARVNPGDEVFANFAALLLHNNRIAMLSQVTLAFNQIVSAYRKQLSLDVATAGELPQEERDAFTARLRDELGPLVSVNWYVNADLLGGMIVRSGDRVLDGSVRGSLERMRNQLLD